MKLDMTHLINSIKSCINRADTYLSNTIIVRHAIYMTTNLHIHRYLVFLLLFSFLFTEYNEIFAVWYDSVAMPYISLFVSDAYIRVGTAVVLVFVTVFFVKKIKCNYRFNNKILLCISCVLFIIAYYRWSGLYEYTSWIGKISYIDAILLIGAMYIVVALINTGRYVYKLHKKRT